MGAAAAAPLAARWRALALPSSRAAAGCSWAGRSSGSGRSPRPSGCRIPGACAVRSAAVGRRRPRPTGCSAGRVLEARVDGVAMPRAGDASRPRGAPAIAGPGRGDDRSARRVGTTDGRPGLPVLLCRSAIPRCWAWGSMAATRCWWCPPARSGSGFGLRRVQLRDAFPPDSGVPVTLHGAIRDGRAPARRALGREGAADRHAARPTQGWLAVPPMKFVLGRWVGLITALWVGALVFPLGYWAASLPRRWAPPGILVAVSWPRDCSCSPRSPGRRRATGRSGRRP